MALGRMVGVTPFGAPVDGLIQQSGLGYRGSPRWQFAKSLGQAIGGLLLTLLGGGGTLGGMGHQSRGFIFVGGLPV